MKFIFSIRNAVIFLSLCLPVATKGNNPSKEPVLPSENIRSVEFYTSRPGAMLPIGRMGEKIVLEFDDIEADGKTLSYRIDRMDKNWDPSTLPETDWLGGFASGVIEEEKSSFNTLVPYTHYRIAFPSDKTRLTLSGNYLITVYYKDPSDPLFSLRFVLYEPLLAVGARIARSEDLSLSDTHQQVDITLSLENLPAVNTARDIRVDVMQNFDFNTLQPDLSPLFATTGKMEFRYPKNAQFAAGNHFRNFEFTDFRSASIQTESIRLENIYHVNLKTDLPYRNSPYLARNDIRGAFRINTHRGDDPSLSSDYAWVRFSLRYPPLPKGQRMYVAGGFNNFTPDAQWELLYDKQKGTYENTVLLKQGFYDYFYLIKDPKTGKTLPFEVDGSFYQSGNSYQVLVYYSDPTGRADRCIGFLSLDAEAR